MDQQRCAAISRIAVLPFTDGPGDHAMNSGNAVAGFITERLAQIGRFRLVERSQLKSIMDELDLQAADLIDPATAAKVGKLAGVDAVVTGSVSQYDSDKTVVYLHVVPIVGWSYKIGATVRIVDVNGGAIVYSNSASGASASDFTEAGKQAVTKMVQPLLNELRRNQNAGASKG
jgi:curli biogenesis system outer membrane secretion channel CsgG